MRQFENSAKPGEPRMRYRRLGATDLEVSVVGIGCWQFSGEWGKQFAQDEVDRMFDRARELGINLLDTAECYGDHLSERLVGHAIKGRRDEWIVATKFGHRFRGHLDRQAAFDAASVRESLDRSLRELETDFIDLYYFHSGSNEELESEGLWEFLRAQVAAGKIRHLGISLTGQSAAVLGQQTRRAKALGVSVIQALYNPLRREAEAEVFPSCIESQLGVIARAPLAQGFLGGKLGRDSRFETADLRHGWSREHIDGIVDRVQKLRETEVPAHADLGHWSIAWCLSNDAVSATLVGCKSVQQVAVNASAVWSGLLPENHPLDSAAHVPAEGIAEPGT